MMSEMQRLIDQEESSMLRASQDTSNFNSMTDAKKHKVLQLGELSIIEKQKPVNESSFVDPSARYFSPHFSITRDMEENESLRLA